jgi:hypothetical protein
MQKVTGRRFKRRQRGRKGEKDDGQNGVEREMSPKKVRPSDDVRGMTELGGLLRRLGRV